MIAKKLDRTPDFFFAEPPSQSDVSEAERANTLLKGFKALQRVTTDPTAITKIVATALVILNLTAGYTPTTS